jgi:hypothetical protein
MSLNALDAAIKALTLSVQANADTETNAITVLNGIPKLIADAVAKAGVAGATPAQLQALADVGTKIDAAKTALAAAIVATVPAPTPIPTPSPAPSPAPPPISIG